MNINLPISEIESWPIVEQAAFNWRLNWLRARKPHQIFPDGEWDVLLFLAGRGAGKTRTAAEELGNWAMNNPGTRWLVTAQTAGDVRSTCFEGDSGLLNVIPMELVASWNVSLFELKLINGSFIKGISAEKPRRFRGPQFHGGWHDEICAWEKPEEVWDMIQFGMRLGKHPRQIVTTTPKPIRLLKKMVSGELELKVEVIRGSSYDNLENLAPTFQKQLLQYEGTDLGDQEIHGKILDDERGGVLRRAWFKLWSRDKDIPYLDYVVISLDTAFTEESRDKETGDPDYTACTVWGIFYDRENKRDAIVLLDAWQARYGFPDLLDRVKRELKLEYGGDYDRPIVKPWIGSVRPRDSGRTPDLVIIEDKGSGISLRQMLNTENVPTLPYNPGKADKLARLHAISHIVKSGYVYLLESPKNPGRPRAFGDYEDNRFVDFTDELLSQLCTFRGRGTIDHDDFVDSTSQAIRYFADRCRISVEIPKVKDLHDDEVIIVDTPIINPYST